MFVSWGRAVAAFAIFSTTASGRAIEPLALETRQDGYHWVDTWTSMPQLVESSNMPPSPFVSPSPCFCTPSVGTLFF